MTQNGLREDQVTQMRGFADQRLRRRAAPLDPVSRHISLIVQYQEKPATEASENDAGAGERSTKESTSEGAPSSLKKE